MNEYRRGFTDGYRFAMGNLEFPEELMTVPTRLPDQPKRKRKVRQTPKQKLLTQMTKKKWDKYKKGSGKKTYVEIRAQVSRSQEFKRKVKRL